MNKWSFSPFSNCRIFDEMCWVIPGASRSTTPESTHNSSCPNIRECCVCYWTPWNPKWRCCWYNIYRWSGLNAVLQGPTPYLRETRFTVSGNSLYVHFISAESTVLYYIVGDISTIFLQSVFTSHWFVEVKLWFLFFSAPPIDVLKEILLAVKRVTFFGFLIALAKSETLNSSIGE